MALRLVVRDDVERRFRRAAMEAHGYGKGALSKAAEEAFDLWANSWRGEGIPKVENPVALISGRLASLSGKYTSVQLQHKAKELWVKK